MLYNLLSKTCKYNVQKVQKDLYYVKDFFKFLLYFVLQKSESNSIYIFKRFKFFKEKYVRFFEYSKMQSYTRMHQRESLLYAEFDLFHSIMEHRNLMEQKFRDFLLLKIVTLKKNSYLMETRIMANIKYFPRSGTTKEVGGMISTTRRKNT